MEKVYIDFTVQNCVDIVFNKELFHATPIIKSFIEDHHIKLDYNKEYGRKFLPICDCIMYPTVNPDICANKFKQADIDKMDREFGKYSPANIPTFHYYSLQRLTNELNYFLKLVVHSCLFPRESYFSFSANYFLNQMEFILENIKNLEYHNSYLTLWCRILDQLVNDKTVSIKRYTDNKPHPIGQYMIEEIKWIKKSIGCA
ncbi:MAG: hypothetical protein M0Q38_10910 [Bacteroidales bacterium]|jgi:hypothetical protein|nr:hypothetical protein [Bacteroidales bacterium]